MAKYRILSDGTGAYKVQVLFWNALGGKYDCWGFDKVTSNVSR